MCLQIDNLDVTAQDIAVKAGEVVASLLQVSQEGANVVVACGKAGGDADVDPVSNDWKHKHRHAA